SAPAVVATVMEWLNPGGSKPWQEWVSDMRPVKQGDPFKRQPVTLTTDGLHFDVRNSRRESKH
ncbi:hypothetical protein PWG14_26645, partial [Chromobacterium amazonense]|uniref:hypothetical protein n=1 Tax=Chromobacterium amazonense TaxID=1382803 RepID=UPI00237E86B5